MQDLTQATSCLIHYKQQPWMALGRTIDFSWSGPKSVDKKHDIDSNPPNKILLVTVSSIVYPVTIEVLATVFGWYGGIQKIIIFQRLQGI